jgi:cytochrome c oxidase cbb3-type subunit 3
MKQILKYFAVVIALLNLYPLHAQNGEALFKAKCNTCHAVDKNSTGPKLQGVKMKWEEAGEGKLMYDWIKNSSALIASGKSSIAATSQNFSPTVMPVQDITDSEIAAIFEYVDAYVPPVSKIENTESKEVIQIVPNYKENQTVFLLLIGLTILMLTAIVLMANTVISYMKSDYFKNKIVERNIEEKKNGEGGKTHNLLSCFLILGFMGLNNHASALSFVPNHDPESNLPWLLVEKTDIYILILLNIILVFVILYIRNIFKQMVRMVKPESQKLVKVKSNAIKKINVILTDAVPVEHEAKILMDHEYDGIQELDNNLPPWWVWGFFATIVFSFIYMFHYHVLKTGDLQITSYDKEMVQSRKDIDSYLAKMAMNVDETNATQLTNENDLSAGKSLFTANCVACHNPKGEGNIGPNLTDEYWIYSPDVKDVFKTIKSGTANGMPEHASKLNPVQIQQVASFILSMPFAGGKAPEGEKYTSVENGKE